MAIAPFPHHYTVALEDRRLVATKQPPITVGAPPQFGGSELVWSPEELLLGAALLCVKTTFDAYARSAGVTIRAWSGTGTGVLDKGPAGPVFTSIKLAIDVETTPEAELRVRDLLKTVERTCIVSRALSVPVEIAPTVRSHARAS